MKKCSNFRMEGLQSLSQSDFEDSQESKSKLELTDFTSSFLGVLASLLFIYIVI